MVEIMPWIFYGLVSKTRLYQIAGITKGLIFDYLIAAPHYLPFCYLAIAFFPTIVATEQNLHSP